MAEGFAGFSREAVNFFARLEKNNNRGWFQAHKEVYERACRAPLQALLAELDPPMGTSHRISRINRDMRFARGGGPYKNYIAGGVGRYYVSLMSQGLYVGTGIYKPEPAVLQRFRAAIDENTSGRALVKIVQTLRRKGYSVDTHESVSSTPRGYDADHPRIDLLRMKDIHAGRLFSPGPVLSSRKLVAAVRRVMTDTEPFGAWLARYVL